MNRRSNSQPSASSRSAPLEATASETRMFESGKTLSGGASAFGVVDFEPRRSRPRTHVQSSPARRF